MRWLGLLLLPVLTACLPDYATTPDGGVINSNAVTLYNASTMSLMRVDDLQRHTTCWVSHTANGGGVSCLPMIDENPP